MIVASSRSISSDDLHTAVGRVVCSLALFTVVVAYVIGVLLVKLQNISL